MPKRVRATTAAFALGAAVLAASPAIAAGSPHRVIEGSALWQTYKARFIKANGRVVDNANGNVSHSEGQGFAMVMAVAANDPATFERIWSFAREKLRVRGDQLFAWRWKPRAFNQVPDRNNATDGDILIAWALMEAAEAGFGDHYAKTARAIRFDIAKLIRRDRALGVFMMPGAYGFSADHQRGVDVINVSYWVMPALERMSALTGETLWASLAGTGPRYIRAASANPAGLPADWNTVKRHSGRVATSRKFDASFSYNAVRVPLYLAWSQSAGAASLKPYAADGSWRRRGLRQVDTVRGRTTGRFDGRGYQAIASTVDCALSGRRFPDALRGGLDKHYYPASLHILSVIAVKQRYPKCW